MSISSERKHELLADLQSTNSHRTCTKCLLLQLIGKLSFACKVVLTTSTLSTGRTIRKCTTSIYLGSLLERKVCSLPLQAVVEILGKHMTRHSHIMSLVRSLYFIAAVHEFHVTVQPIPGIDNSMAVALSHFQVERFRRLADASPTTIRDPKTHSTRSAETYGILSGLQ